MNYEGFPGRPATLQLPGQAVPVFWILFLELCVYA